MNYNFDNIDMIRAFVRNVDDLPNSSRRVAQRMGDRMRSIIITRVSQSQFLGGRWETKPYSVNPIKAFKLGTAVVTGKGMGKKLTINGILIDRQDWFWGRWDMEQHGIDLSASRPAEGGRFHGSHTGKPAPVFIPGYRGWRVDYNQKTSEVNLNFSGSMLDNFDVDILKSRGSNQYGGNWEFRFNVREPFYDIGQMTDYYRNWLSVTEEEVRQAIRESGADIADLFLRPR